MTTLRSLTIPLGQLPSATGLLDYLVRDEALCWIRRGTGLLGFGEAARFTTTGQDRFESAQQWWRTQLAEADVVNHVGGPGTGPLAFGSFAFSSTSPHESRLIVPQLVLGSSPGTPGPADAGPEAVDGDPAGRTWLTYLTYDDGAELTAEAAQAALAGYLEEASAERDSSSGSGAGGDRLAGGSLTEAEWMRAVGEGVRRIRAGRLSKLVLARDIVARLGSPIATAQVLRELAVRYRDCWTYSVDGLIGSTPEMLIKVEDNVARARVLAGTLDRTAVNKTTGESDAEYALRVLAGSEKQQHEHQFAIESLTRQLEPFTRSMTSHSEPFVLELPNVWHLASDVTAELSPVAGNGVPPAGGTTAAGGTAAAASVPTSLALAAALHPTAAVCGTPTDSAARVILELEHMDRGPYAGPVGWIDGAGNGEWGIALRGAVLEDPRTVRLYAGCGIVDGSSPEAELAETWSKFRPMMEALGVRR